jgi:hypothetical protein
VRPTNKWFAALGGIIVALATEFFINPFDGRALVWNDGEWKILAAGVVSLVTAYLVRNQSTATGDGVPRAAKGPHGKV